MNKTKVKCPRCHSDQLYKFGLDKQANQKYQCKKCKRQFAPDSVSKSKESKYPKCPKCGKATFLHHSYKHYNRYKCGNKKCNHVIVHYHNLNIDNDSNENLTGSLSMKGMRFSLHVILTALTLYFLNNTSTRAISHFLYATSNIKVSHVTISSWVLKFAPFFKQKADSFKTQLNLQSDDWHADHIPVAPISSDTNNNLIKSFNKTFKAWYKAKKGFNSFKKANNLIYLFIFHYNFIRPHGSLNNHTPAEVAGFTSDSKSKNY